MNKMKLIVLTKQFGSYTGATVSTIEILKRIAKDFESVTVITMKSEKVNIKNVKILVVPSYKDLISEVRKRKNIQNSVGYSDDHLGFLFSFFNIDYIHTYHGNWPDAKKLNMAMFVKSLFFIPLYKKTLKRAKLVISVSNYMQNKFVKKYAKKSIVIYNGIKQKQTLNYNKKASNNNFLMVGNVDERKYKNAISVFFKLKKHKFSGQIDIYGALLDEKIKQKLEQFYFVKLKGTVKNINYKSYSALICTSNSENLPVSIVEALLNRVPVLSFDVGGIKEVVSNGINGYLFEKSDDLADQILSFKPINIPQSNTEFLEGTFDWNVSSVKYKKLLMNSGESNENSNSRSNT